MKLFISEKENFKATVGIAKERIILDLWVDDEWVVIGMLCSKHQNTEQFYFIQAQYKRNPNINIAESFIDICLAQQDDLEIKAINKENNNELDEKEVYQGSNYDECRGY